MTLNLTDAQLDQVAAGLFLCQPLNATKLPKPVGVWDDLSLPPKLDPIGARADFQHLGIGVAEFANPAMPKVWFHNGGDAWRIASTAKISMLLAAVQLRDDVRWLFDQGLVTTPEQADLLFASPKLWKRAKSPSARALARTAAPPRVSTLFNYPAGGGRPDLLGPDMSVAANRRDVVDRIKAATGTDDQHAHLTWPITTDFEFTELLWLAGGRSDNIAATACISEIGVAYIKAVQLAYGLFDGADLRLFLSGGYADVDTRTPVSNRSNTVRYRALHDVEARHVKDALFDRATRQYDDHLTSESGSAEGLIAYMIAWKQNVIAKVGRSTAQAQEASNLIRTFLADGSALATVSLVADGVATVLGALVDVEMTKIGLLGRADGEPANLDCEFAYLETRDAAGGAHKYGVVVTGIRKVPNGLNVVQLPKQLGAAIQTALSP